MINSTESPSSITGLPPLAHTPTASRACLAMGWQCVSPGLQLGPDVHLGQVWGRVPGHGVLRALQPHKPYLEQAELSGRAGWVAAGRRTATCWAGMALEPGHSRILGRLAQSPQPGIGLAQRECTRGMSPWACFSLGKVPEEYSDSLQIWSVLGSE